MGDFNAVDDYIDAQPEANRRILYRVRDAIRKAVPKAEETIAYKIPAYKLPGGPVLYFAGWKKHFSLYPASPGVVAAFKNELATYEVIKGTIRFPLTEPVPVRLIAGIAKFRAREAKEKAAAKKQR